MSPPAHSRPDLLIGIDGGGSHVEVLLADARTEQVLGRGKGGPANLQAVGVEATLRELDLSIARAFASAGLPAGQVAAACLGLAGVDWENGLDVIHSWARRTRLAGTVSVVNDATLLLAAGTEEGWGLAIVAGTGSIAYVRTRDGVEGRAGGWGYLLGDEGSAYQITLSALRSACRSVDRCIGPTSLVDLFVRRMGVKGPAEIIDAVYRGPWDRAALAALAPLVLEAAEAGDEVARRVVEKQAGNLALTAAVPVLNLNLPRIDLPVALTGGLVLRSEMYRELFLEKLRGHGVLPGHVQLVEGPALGAIVLAKRSLRPRD